MVYSSSISHPNIFSPVTGKTIVDTALESINRCISLLILTGYTELFGDPAFGSGIYETQFELVSDAYFEKLKLIICDAIEKYESRVTVSNEDIYIIHDKTTNRIYIRVGYTIKGTNQYAEADLSMGVQQ